MRTPPAFPDPAPRVRFDRHDLALYWGYVQGADDLRALHATYFPDQGLADLRHVRARARAIAQELAAAARRTARPELAAIFLRDPRAIGEGDPSAPTLEEFRAEVDAGGYYAEAELLALWTERHGHADGNRLEQRRARLRTRIREGLAWIETQLFPVPQPQHRIDGWLPMAYARRLEAAGLVTLEQLLERINTRGRRWSRGIAGIGVTKAQQIEGWVRRYERPGTPLRLLPSSTLSAVQLAGHRSDLAAGVGQGGLAPASAIVPMERIRLPQVLDGSEGRFRAPREACPLDADNDLAAIRAWLAVKASPHTRRAYTREAERLLLWCLVVLDKPVSSMTVEDCERYRAFVRDPQPAAQWCAPRGTPRWSRAWRPFEAGLSPAGERHALIVLKAMAAWLRQQNYLTANPWAALAATGAVRQTLDKRRAFTPAQWQLIADELERLPDTGARARLKFALWLLYGTGLRLEEAVGRRLRDIDRGQLSDGSVVWRMKVVGKRGKLREVPLARELVSRLSAYLTTRNYASIEDAPPAAYVLARSMGEEGPLPNGLAYEDEGGILAGTLYRQVKAFFKRVAKGCAASDPEAAARLMRASTHWLRHTFGTRIANLTHDVVLTRDLLGHESVATTSIYLDGDEIQQRDAVERLMAQVRAGAVLPAGPARRSVPR